MYKNLTMVIEELRAAKKLQWVAPVAEYKKGIERLMPYEAEINHVISFYRLDCLIGLCQDNPYEMEQESELVEFYKHLVSEINWGWIEEFPVPAAKAAEWKERILEFSNLLQ